ncbi:MAG: gamma-glutamyltransferase [Bryobacteraceae bacterium]
MEAQRVRVPLQPRSRAGHLSAGGNAPQAGQIFRNCLARAFTLIAEKGPDTVYRGEIAAAILDTSRKVGGKFQASDLSEWQPEWVDPVSTNYRGWTVYELPPNGSGVGALEMLNIMEAKDLRQWPAGSAEALHWRTQAMRLAFADLWHAVSDPRFVRVPVQHLTSKEFAQRRSATIDPDRANCEAVASDELTTSRNTTYLAVIDREGNIVSSIQSIANLWGSGVNVGGMGFHLQNRGSYFRLDPKHANALAPRKRPFHTILPAFMEKGDQHIAFGIMGGPGQPYSHGQFVSNIADYDMNIQAAMDAPRFSGTPTNDCKIAVESRVSQAALEGLRKRGHDITILGMFDLLGVGVGQAVRRDSLTGVNYGASDARGDGAATPEGVGRPTGKTPRKR